MIKNHCWDFLRTLLAHIKHCLVAFIIYTPHSSLFSSSHSTCHDLEQSVLTEVTGSFPLHSRAESMTLLTYSPPAQLQSPSVSLDCVNPSTAHPQLSSPVSGSWPLACSQSSGSSGGLAGKLTAALSPQHLHPPSSAQVKPVPFCSGDPLR